MKYCIVVVDDEEICRHQLKNMLARYSAEEGIETEVRFYDKPLAFLQNYRSDADIVFVDIKMPGMDGMQLAESLRAADKETAIIFTTSFLRYAIEGYAVQASGYLLKPLEYEQFRLTMRRVTSAIGARVNKTITVKDENGVKRIPIKDISFIEVFGRELTIHLATGGSVSTKGTLRGLEEELTPYGFFRCAHSFFVNLRRVNAVGKSEITIDGKIIPISRGTKKEFLAALAEYSGNN